MTTRLIGMQRSNSNTTGYWATSQWVSSAGINLTTGSNNIDIGAPGVAGESGVIRIGKSPTATATFIAGISGKTVANGVGVSLIPADSLVPFSPRPASRRYQADG